MGVAQAKSRPVLLWKVEVVAVAVNSMPTLCGVRED